MQVFPSVPIGSLQRIGAISGCVSRTLTAPLDRIKVLMQADLGGVNYTIRQANAKIWREGGFKAYFKYVHQNSAHFS